MQNNAPITRLCQKSEIVLCSQLKRNGESAMSGFIATVGSKIRRHDSRLAEIFDPYSFLSRCKKLSRLIAVPGCFQHMAFPD